MEFLRNIREAKDLIQETIARYGYAPEHNYYWYEYCQENLMHNVCVRFDDGCCLLTQEEKGKNYIFSEPVAPPDRRVEILIEYLVQALQGGAIEKVVLELRTETRKALLAALPESLRARSINYSMTWPIMDIAHFDASLPGKRFKHLRNARNKFYHEHQVEIKNHSEVSKEKLHEIVEVWRRTRGGTDRTFYRRYHALIDAEFQGTDAARIFVVDGIPVGMNGGWMVPNSERFYGAIGIHDYSLQDLGLALYLEDLEWLKCNGHKEADMGGGEKPLTRFKEQFGPSSAYQTHVFSIVRNA